jgi:hypothetical protein
MPRKRYKPEEIVAKLRQVDVLVSLDLICLASCKHLSGVTRWIGAPKWGIRSRTPV